MYERFTDRARKVMQLANQEAQRFNHEYIGTEHVLLGLIKEGSGVASNVLKNAGVDVRKARMEVEKLIMPGPDMVTMGKLPQTPRTKKVIELSIQIARECNDNHVGTEHILLGLIREGEGTAAQVLLNLGCTFDKIRQETMDLLGKSLLPPMKFHLHEFVRSSSHSFCHLFANGANCGSLCLTPDEFERLARIMAAGHCDPLLNVEVEISDEQVRAKEGP